MVTPYKQSTDMSIEDIGGCEKKLIYRFKMCNALKQ